MITRVTIDITQEEDYHLIQNLLKRLGIPSQVEDVPTNGKEVVAIMQALADSQSFSEIKDPVAWQREIRQDRPLPFRH